MPINANIPLSVRGVNPVDYMTPAKNALEMRGMSQAQNIATEKMKNYRSDRVNAASDAEGKASLEAMARIHQVEQGWVNKYMKDGMNQSSANQKAIATVQPYAKTEMDHHNQRYGTKYTLQDIEQARAPMAQIMTEYQKQMNIQKLKNKGKIKASVKTPKVTIKGDSQSGFTAIRHNPDGSLERISIKGINDKKSAQELSDRANEAANAWVEGQAKYTNSDATDFADYGGNREQARVDKYKEFLDIFSGQSVQQQPPDSIQQPPDSAQQASGNFSKLWGE